MSKHTCFLLIVCFSLLGLAAAGADAGQTPLIHENPASLKAQQPFDVNGRLMLQLEQMFGSLDDVMFSINASNFDASHLSMNDFDRYFQLFRANLDLINLPESDYQRVLGQANVTANDLQAMIDKSESYNRSMASFVAAWTEGDMMNATIAAVDLQEYMDAMNSSSQQLTASASVISRLLQNTSVNFNHLDRGIDRLNAFMGRIEVENQLPMSLLGSTNLTLKASEVNVSTGDMVIFTTYLTSDNMTIGQGMISLAIDGKPVANATPADDGTGVIFYVIRGGTFGRVINAIAYYDPQGANFTRAVSNNVELTRRPITPDLTIGITPDTARFGDVVHVRGRLTADGGFPVSNHLVGVSLPDRPACSANSSDNGSYYCDLIISPQVPAGRLDIVSQYKADYAPDDVLTDARSPPAALYVFPETTSLTLYPPPAVLRGGENVNFAGTLESSSGKPVYGEVVSIYVDDLRVCGDYTDAFGRYNVSGSVPCNLTPGTYPVYAAYRPAGGMSLSGSQSSGYEIAFTEAPPTIQVYGIPLIAFQGDALDLLVNVTAMGTPVNESRLTVNLSGLTLGRGMTNDTGNFFLLYRINGSAGLQTITVNCTANGLLAAADVNAGVVLIVPFDLPTSLAIVVIALSVAGLVVARVTNVRRRLAEVSRARRKPLPKPTISVTPQPETPGGWSTRPEPTRFEDEVIRISAIIAGGADHREVIAEIYLAARRMTGAHGFVIPESATHREFYRMLIAREPRLNLSAGTITKHYEAAVFGHKLLSENEIVGSLYSLKEINMLVAGEPGGGGP